MKSEKYSSAHSARADLFEGSDIVGTGGPKNGGKLPFGNSLHTKRRRRGGEELEGKKKWQEGGAH